MKEKKMNIIGIIGFVLSLTSLFCICINQYIAIVISIIALVMSCIGMRSKYNLKGFPIAGLVISIIAVIITLFIFVVSALNENVVSDTNTDTNTNDTDYSIVPEESDDPWRDSEKTTSENTEAVNLWETSYYVDNFNQPTQERYIYNSESYVGTFNNSATTNSDLLVDVTVDKENICFFIYKYGSQQLKNASSSFEDNYNIIMRTADGTDYNFTGTMYCGDDRITIDQSHIPDVVSALSQGEDSKVSFYIEDAERTTDNYLFEVISNNFSEQYNSLMQ